MITFIVIKTQFEAIHHWPNCNIKEVSFLRWPHRHVFHVTVKWQVLHNDRDREFIMAKREVDKFLASFKGDLGSMSCESLCHEIHKKFLDSVFVSVFEDDENGAEMIIS